MPGKIRVKIISARNLPIMDRSSESTDAFVEIRFGENNYDKTSVCKKTLDPQWNTRFVFEVEEDEIQEEPLQIRVLDHDTYSSHDAIGKVYIDLKPLLNKDGPNSIHGWFPIYDTMHGIRGEIQIQVEVEVLSDCNEYKKSSCGVTFYCSSKVPEGCILQSIGGFVEELLINDDPEYQWIDKIRTPRTSNEARQKLFLKLSGEVQRRIGLKVLDMNANCVLGYTQYFDLEGEYGIVVRGIGTAANVLKQNIPSPMVLHSPPQNQQIIQQQSVNIPAISPLTSPNTLTNLNEPPIFFISSSTTTATTTNTQQQKLIKKSSPNRPGLQRGHSDPNLSQTAQTQNSLQATQTTFTQNTGPTQHDTVNQPLHHPSIASTASKQTANHLIFQQSTLDKMEFPFLTLQQYPVGFIKSICGVVCARSVKVHNQSTQSTVTDLRDKWWIEIRNEIYSQMESLNCHVVLGYTETKSICEDVYVLSAMGTAACVDLQYFMTSQPLFVNTNLTNSINFNQNNSFEYVNNDYIKLFDNPQIKTCSMLHVMPSIATTICSTSANVPSTQTQQQQQQLTQLQQQQQQSTDDDNNQLATHLCNICNNNQVPDVLFLTMQPLPEIQTIGKGCLIKAIVSRPRKKCSGELSAKIISDCLPFMEYELHQQLLNKLKLNGMNTLYGLSIQISLGENFIIGLAEATGCRIVALPIPQVPKLVQIMSKNQQPSPQIDELQKRFVEKMAENVEFFNLNDSNLTNGNHTNPCSLNNSSNANNESANGNTTDTNNDLQQQIENTDFSNYIKIDLEDIYEIENAYSLLDPVYKHKKGFYICNTEYMPGITNFINNIQMFTRVFRCETSLVQIHNKGFNEIIGKILTSLRYKFRNYLNCCLSNLSFDISLYDDDHAMIIATGCCMKYDENSKQSTASMTSSTTTPALTYNDNSVELTTLSYVPNTTIEHYLGHINLFLIRESTSIREFGGCNGFMNCFLNEVFSLARAHVRSLGGNALVSYKMKECLLLDNPHKNQGQCLINIVGDAVQLSKQMNF